MCECCCLPWSVFQEITEFLLRRNRRMSAQYARNVSTSLTPNPTLVKEPCRLLTLSFHPTLSNPLPERVSPTFHGGLLLLVHCWGGGEDTTQVIGCVLLSSTNWTRGRKSSSSWLQRIEQHWPLRHWTSSSSHPPRVSTLHLRWLTIQAKEATKDAWYRGCKTKKFESVCREQGELERNRKQERWSGLCFFWD